MPTRDGLAAALPAHAPGPVLVGYSGGVDSTALLHALAQRPAYRAAGLRALHVHHGLHPEADAWAAHCQTACARWGVPLQVVRVTIARDSGLGLEGAARAARRAAFAQALQPGEWLALAHHRDDQAETFLLRALRASGPDGLAAMRPQRSFAAGTLWRPLLALPRAALLAHARHHALAWIDDPANADPHHDRNFLRAQLLPLLRERWPQADAALARSAALSAEASDLLGDDEAALLPALLHGDALDLAGLRALPAARRARLLRRWSDAQGAPPLPAQGIAALEREVAAAASDRDGGFAWQGVEIRRWRQHLYLRRPAPPWPPGWQRDWDGRAPLALPDGTRLALDAADGLAFATPLQVRLRRGGERIALPGRTHTHALKHVLQAAGLPPWRRATLPLLCDGERVLAAGAELLSDTLAAWLAQHSARLRHDLEPGAN